MLWVIGSFCGGVVGSHYLFNKAVLNEWYSRPEYQMPHPLSRLGIIESGADQSGDGHTDTWQMVINQSAPRETYFMIRDIDADEKADLVGVYFGNAAHDTYFTQIARGEDHLIESAELRLKNHHAPESSFLYVDEDGDSVLDVVWIQTGDADPVEESLGLPGR